ncbi:shikimate kinase [Paenibacillus sp. LHD-117]|uniref:shikimate kinase n=1 Tax=Paenibacillus sp. LHD-117 TaxID=3071412 RepID=UPI0027E073B8|nr:shikimate kinase [Paenibacillus sp. LHD-117]MDQ6420876.1 shikimate kinase [Paenibacillus sp. LHD-117]
MDSRAVNKLVLIGFMGTGKSSVSRELSEQLGWARMDSDDEIVLREQRTIADIFSSDGEQRFRDIESEAISDILHREEPAVVATGGGAVLRERNRALMLEKSFVVALAADADSIIARVSQDEERPLLQGDAGARVHALLEQRRGAYDFAHATIDTTGMSVKDVARDILQRLHDAFETGKSIE